MLITWLTAPNEITPDLRTLMRYLAIARKGLDGELLSAVSGWSRTRCDEMLTHIRERRFVRIRPEDMRVFLHDEVYAWLDTFLLSGDIEHVRNNITKKFIEWYAHRANQAETEEKRDTLCVDSLVYRLRSNPQKAYDWYAELDDEAIRGAEIGLDMRLRTEMLGFLNSESPIDLNALPKDDQLRRLIAADTAARWVKRYMARGQYDLPIQVGTQVFQSEKLLPTNSFFLLSRADLAVYFGQALIYVGRYSEGVKVLQDALNGMERKAKPEVLVEQHKGLSDSRRRNRILGRGHNNLGYSYWLDYGHLALARKEFESARTYLEASGDIEEVANTFDNEGRVESELGHTNKAQTHIMMGLDKRKVRGRKYRIALSMNSRAITFIETVPSNAITLAKRALKECIDLGTSRGIGLCYITLGQASRAYGRNWKEDIITPEQGEDYFLDGLEYLGLAYTIFGGSVQQTAVRSRIPDAIVDEPVRLIEATNEIGCTFRDRAELLRSWDPGSPDNIFTLENAEQKAIEYLSESI
ncbi:MAG: hypothetical protein KC777_29825, partial [Cyanobacteria bacterium HKST-UBA02]|nr:hypothetical protein [Cyanobacteria bacterium HKST-UBA02]